MGTPHWVQMNRSDDAPWVLAEVDEQGQWSVSNGRQAFKYPPAVIGPRAYPPGHPATPPACDLPRVLDLIAAYLAPSQPISYGKLVELLGRTQGCDGYGYSDLYPRLFNVQQHPDPHPGELAVVYDCEAAATKLRAELGLPQPRSIPDLFSDVLAQLTKADQRQIADLMGPKAWGIVTATEKAPNDAEAMAFLADLADALEELDPSALEALGIALAKIFNDREIDQASGLVHVIHRAALSRTRKVEDDVH